MIINPRLVGYKVMYRSVYSQQLTYFGIIDPTKDINAVHQAHHHNTFHGGDHMHD